ncbi:MAG: PEPxxWA-CTERM sorting domain-containing protein [Alphaproteobacteria bacterium]|nr:PEPxxWA-CTERM sorting domain-containing protein [Alphaproteobacteria bacterium]
METAWTEGKGKMRAGAAGYLLGYDKAGAFTGTGLPAAEVWDRLASHSGTFSLYDNKKLVGSAVVRDIGVEATSLVPEPATWAMMIAGFALVGGAARRRRAMA